MNLLTDISMWFESLMRSLQRLYNLEIYKFLTCLAIFSYYQEWNVKGNYFNIDHLVYRLEKCHWIVLHVYDTINTQ